MSELMKTVAFLAVALVSAVLAIATQSGDRSAAPPEDANAVLFPEFKDPLAAQVLRIVRFDEVLGQPRDIEVKKVEDLWVLPSHNNYPADAENRIRDAATTFVDLKALGVISDSQGDHELYGVLDPTETKAKNGEGVGTLVTIKGAKDQDLVQLIIGKPVKENEAHRFVRRPGQARVFQVAIDPNKLPVRFEDWIEKDLLQVEAWDISQLMLKDYSFQVTPNLFGQPVTDFDQRSVITVSEESGNWTLDELLENRDGQLQATTLLEGEELNSERLNSLKDALADLEIVDVEKKPAGLGADLKADKGFFENQEGVKSLMERGFYPVRLDQDQVEMLSTEGEVISRTREGIEYVLRFGQVAGVDTDSNEGKLNRYLLVSARLYEDAFPEPELEPLPELPPGDSPEEGADEGTDVEAAEEGATDEATSESAQPTDGAHQTAHQTAYVAAQDEPQDESADEGTEDESTDEANDSEAAAETPAADESSPADTPEAVTEAAAEETAAEDDATSSPAEETQLAQPPLDDAAAADAAAEETDNAAADESPAEQSAPESVEETANDGTSAAEQTEASPPSREEILAERERITKENQRKIDEHKDKLQKAQQKVRELNYRFADWYYVISEDMYKKIHLGRADIVKESDEAEEQGFGVDALRNLEQQGLTLPDTLEAQ